MKKLGLGTVFLCSVGSLLGCPPIVVDTGGTGDDDDPCAAVRCAEGTHCEVTEVQCVTEPCPPLVQCLPDEEPPEPIGCEVVLCKEGTICIDTEEGPQCVPPEENPCNLVDCRPDHTCVVENGEPTCVPVEVDECGGTCGEGQHCELIYPPCAPPDEDAAREFAPPACEPIPTCVDNVGCEAVLCAEGTYCDDSSGKPECWPAPTCEVVDCMPGHVCEMVDVECFGRSPCPPQPQCVPVEGGLGCQTVKCKEGYYCDDISGAPECLPLPSCAAVDCAPGYTCELVDVQCVRAPCPPQPECVPVGKDPCALVDCVEGTHCELVEVVCVTEPCDPQAQCVPDGFCGND